MANSIGYYNIGNLSSKNMICDDKWCNHINKRNNYSVWIIESYKDILIYSLHPELALSSNEYVLRERDWKIKWKKFWKYKYKKFENYKNKINLYLKMDISTLCTPLIVQIFFFVLFVISYIYLIISDSSNYSISNLIYNVIWNLLTILLVYYLCSIGYITLSWFIVIFPLIIVFFVVMAFLLVAVNSDKTHKPTVHSPVYLPTVPSSTQMA